jgi:hypothetical protein
MCRAGGSFFVHGPSLQPRLLSFRAHLACDRREAFEPPVLMGFFFGSKDAHIKRDPMSEHMPDNSGQFVGHGGDGLGSTEFGP